MFFLLVVVALGSNECTLLTAIVALLGDITVRFEGALTMRYSPGMLDTFMIV